MKARISAVGEAKISGIFNCTEREYEIIEKAIDSLGNEIDESYSPIVYLEKLEEKVI